MHKVLSKSEIKFIKKSILIMAFLFLASNLVTVVINTFLNQFLISPEFQESVKIVQADATIMITSNFLPFPFMTLFLVLYLVPIYREMKTFKMSNTSYVRLINIPIFFSFISGLSWVIGTLSFESQIILRGFSNNWHWILESSLLTLSMAITSFVLSYYLLDYFQRTLIVPKIFAGSQFNEITDGLRPNLKQRFYIYIVTISILPGFMTFRLLQTFNNNGDNVFGRNLISEIVIMFAIIGFLIFIITLFLTNSIRSPLDKMRLQAEEIQNGNFNKIMLVDTRDEIGNLSSTMNSMTISLAEKEKINDTFGRMVDPKVRDFLLSGNLKLGGEQSEAVILFSDLAGFTTLSENRTPAEVVSMLNRYFGLMSNCVSKHGGIVNKFIGDAILAIFGMPIPLEFSADSALQCAIDMQEAGKKLNEELELEGLPLMKTRIGIHKGFVIAGNIGSHTRMEYTVIGDTVNTASRLESACKKFDVNILFSEEVKESLENNYNFKKIGSLMLKGKSQAISTFTLNQE
ncbi:adenylate/guanylate cyclase domain-containing protein [Leptospira sp. GIMC2001]|uniref:adenylate/guanylate cyclase domain-containing protein n=1 Tax=Leptospira sp. GIMC2001 TaxID=1513297 RepID=UPI00234BF4BE|nr:adenylate/guanylate cyclase domain-containing protein [Leptospira sp. GIMC2001]WCL49915.1 adenylate/guanylate cyclase domain-containing protein [Leptospira sp. GIMC2001]